MLTTTLPPMRPELAVCPNSECDASGRIGVHSHKERRYICHACNDTFAETTATLLYGLKHPIALVLVVLSLLAYGCPIGAIVATFALHERTVADWQLKAGRHAKTVQEQVVCQGHVEVGQVQADELYTKTQARSIWVATAMTVFSRLWVWGAISWDRDAALVEPVIAHVRAAAQPGLPLLFAVDGFTAYVGCILKVFRDPQRSGKRARPAAQGLGRLAHRASGQAAPRAPAPQHHPAVGAWQSDARRSDQAGDTGGTGPDQHGVYRAAECHLAHLDAGLGAPYPDTVGCP
jgi:transposase-like protein